MRGQNFIFLNAASVKEAIQEYLDKRAAVGAGPTVAWVDTNNLVSNTLLRVATLEPPAEETKAG